jgi:hypothetical protein
LFGMALLGHDAVEQSAVAGPIVLAQSPKWEGVHSSPLVRLGPVMIDGSGDVGHIAPCRAAHAHSAVEDLYRRGGGP